MDIVRCRPVAVDAFEHLASAVVGWVAYAVCPGNIRPGARYRIERRGCSGVAGVRHRIEIASLVVIIVRRVRIAVGDCAKPK